MPMPPIEFYVTMFRDERDQARSQFVLLFLMEALCRANQSLIRHADGRADEQSALKKMVDGITVSGGGKRDLTMLGLDGQKLPLLYEAGVHYEREPPGQEHWPDIVNILQTFDGPGQYPGPWADCEDLACWRVAELREAAEHNEGGKKVKGGVKARPFAKWRRGSEGQFNYHALVLRPDGKIEDPSLVLGMRREAQFAADGTAEKLRLHQVQPVIQFADPPDVMVVDPTAPGGTRNRTDSKGLVGSKVKPGMPELPPIVEGDEARAKVKEGTWDSYGEMDLSDYLEDS